MEYLKITYLTEAGNNSRIARIKAKEEERRRVTTLNSLFHYLNAY
jgi:hypothetical protein